MILNPFNVDQKLQGVLEKFADDPENNLWLAYIKIEDASVPRKAIRNKTGFLLCAYISADVDEQGDYIQYLGIRHQLLLGVNIPASDLNNSVTRRKLWLMAKRLEDLLSENNFLVAVGPEDAPATDMRINFFLNYTRGTVALH